MLLVFKFFLKGNDKFSLKQKTGLKRFRHYQMEESEFIRDSKFFLITHDELDQLVYILAILLTIASKIEYQLQISTLEQNSVKFVPHLRQTSETDRQTDRQTDSAVPVTKTSSTELFILTP